jgi:hypothetical protein
MTKAIKILASAEIWVDVAKLDLLPSRVGSERFGREVDNVLESVNRAEREISEGHTLHPRLVRVRNKLILLGIFHRKDSGQAAAQARAAIAGAAYSA